MAMRIIGFTLLLLSAIAFFVGAGTFTMSGVPEWLSTIGLYCFAGWWMPLIIGIVLLVLSPKPRRPHAASIP